MEKKSLNAVTIGPEATAGSTPILEKKRGEKTPKRVPTKQAPKSPQLTTIPIMAGWTNTADPEDISSK